MHLKVYDYEIFNFVCNNKWCPCTVPETFQTTHSDYLIWLPIHWQFLSSFTYSDSVAALTVRCSHLQRHQIILQVIYFLFDAHAFRQTIREWGYIYICSWELAETMYSYYNSSLSMEMCSYNAHVVCDIKKNLNSWLLPLIIFSCMMHLVWCWHV